MRGKLKKNRGKIEDPGDKKQLEAFPRESMSLSLSLSHARDGFKFSDANATSNNVNLKLNEI